MLVSFVSIVDPAMLRLYSIVYCLLHIVICLLLIAYIRLFIVYCPAPRPQTLMGHLVRQDPGFVQDMGVSQKVLPPQRSRIISSWCFLPAVAVTFFDFTAAMGQDKKLTSMKGVELAPYLLISSCIGLSLPFSGTTHGSSEVLGFAYGSGRCS